jgi:hypothetical protein
MAHLPNVASEKFRWHINATVLSSVSNYDGSQIELDPNAARNPIAVLEQQLGHAAADRTESK